MTRFACLLALLLPAAALADGYYQGYAPTIVTKTKVIGVPVAPPYYFSVGAGDPDEQAERVARKTVEILKKSGALQPPAQADQPTPEDKQEELTTDDFRLVGRGKANLDRQVFAVFNSSCIQCHKPGATKPGNVQLFTADRTLFKDADPKREYARRSRILAAVDHSTGGEMPKNGRPLPPAQVAAIRKWADEAAYREIQK
jgi:mono/diheme cytochrome c family protein